MDFYSLLCDNTITASFTYIKKINFWIRLTKERKEAVNKYLIFLARCKNGRETEVGSRKCVCVCVCVYLCVCVCVRERERDRERGAFNDGNHIYCKVAISRELMENLNTLSHTQIKCFSTYLNQISINYFLLISNK